MDGLPVSFLSLFAFLRIPESTTTFLGQFFEKKCVRMFLQASYNKIKDVVQDAVTNKINFKARDFFFSKFLPFISCFFKFFILKIQRSNKYLRKEENGKNMQKNHQQMNIDQKFCLHLRKQSQRIEVISLRQWCQTHFHWGPHQPCSCECNFVSLTVKELLHLYSPKIISAL